MRTIDIAVKDLKQVFKNVFSLVMMFGAPLLITGLLYFAFGSLASGSGEYTLPVTKVQVVNLDQAGAQPASFAAGQMLVDFLRDPSLADVIDVSLAPDEASARQAVDEQQAGVVLIIPSGFTTAATSPGKAAVTLYQDPTLTIGPGIVKDLVSHFLDGFSGVKIAGQVTAGGLSGAGVKPDAALLGQVAQKYTAWLDASEHGGGEASSLDIISPGGQAQPTSQSANMFGPIMAGMLIYFTFFIGANEAGSIISEDEQGTLARLFGTPARLSEILSGKFLGVVVSLIIQVVVLLLASRFLFGIHWGQPSAVIPVAIGLIVAAAGFGVMLMSFIKTSRQTGPVLGGVMTLTGMLGGLFTTGIPNISPAFEKLTLITPQGWAMQAWKGALSGTGTAQMLVPSLVLVGMGLVFLTVGIVLFRKRFA